MFGLDDAIAAGLKVIDKFVPDPAAKQQAENDLRESLSNWDAAQNRVNEAQANSDNLFVSGARPAILWILAFALAYSYVIVPIGMWVAQVRGLNIPKPPVLDNNLWELMFGLLGMGGLRTYEKIKGVAAGK